ncbi:MAG: methyltransferase domain-containing protein [Phycisphaerae bacterium]|nr:methyltransferase domain-containing protein [Phycisphaerae bacterium]
MTTPEVIGGKGAHDALRRVLRARPKAKVLDCPSGQGGLAAYMRDLGWDVHCSDIDEGNLRVTGMPFRAANLNRGLPHADAEFDVVVCANGLHRLFNPGRAVAEFHRILRPGGTLFLNLNNYSALGRRLRFLIYGSLDNALNEGKCEQTTTDPEANVRVPFLLPVAGNLLKSAGFEVRQCWASGTDARTMILWPLALALRGLGMLAPPKSRKRNHLALTNSAAAFPGGRYVLIEATKRADR